MEHKAHTTVKLIHLLTFAMCRRSPSHTGSVLLTVFETEALNTPHNYDMPNTHLLPTHSHPDEQRGTKLLVYPCFKLSIISCNSNTLKYVPYLL
jgi:hypothetical protein